MIIYFIIAFVILCPHRQFIQTPRPPFTVVMVSVCYSLRVGSKTYLPPLAEPSEFSVLSEATKGSGQHGVAAAVGPVSYVPIQPSLQPVASSHDGHGTTAVSTRSS